MILNNIQEILVVRHLANASGTATFKPYNSKNTSWKNIKTVSDTQSDERILSILPYVKGTIDQIGRILNKHNIRTTFKLPKKIGQILRNPKDQSSSLSSAEVYKISIPADKYTLEKPGEWSIYR